MTPIPLPPKVIAALADSPAASTSHVLLPAYRVGGAVVCLPTNRVEETMLKKYTCTELHDDGADDSEAERGPSKEIQARDPSDAAERFAGHISDIDYREVTVEVVGPDGVAHIFDCDVEWEPSVFANKRKPKTDAAAEVKP